MFLYDFPKIGQGIGGRGAAAESAFATILVPGVAGISIMFQGVQSIALNMAQEFGFTREIEDRVQAPCPIWLVAIAKVLSGSVQGALSAAIVLPIADVVHAAVVHAHLDLHWWIVLTLVLLNSLIYVTEGMRRAAFTSFPHMHLYVVYPVLTGFAAALLAIGLRNFRRRVLS